MTTTTTQAAVHVRADQASHFFVVTVQVNGKPLTISGGVTPGQGQTRQHLYDQICTEVIAGFPNYQQLPVLFFSLERNQL